MPTLAGWWLGNDVALRLRHGLIEEDDAGSQATERALDRAALVQRLRDDGLLERGHIDPPGSASKVACRSTSPSRRIASSPAPAAFLPACASRISRAKFPRPTCRAPSTSIPTGSCAPPSPSRIFPKRGCSGSSPKPWPRKDRSEHDHAPRHVSPAVQRRDGFRPRRRHRALSEAPRRQPPLCLAHLQRGGRLYPRL